MRKSSLIKANIVIMVMFIALVGIGFSNSSITASADPRVIYSGNTNNNNVSFMINVYEGNEYVHNILDILDVYGVKTTFFVGGVWATKNIDLIREIYSRGHELGNHGFYHKEHE